MLCFRDTQKLWGVFSKMGVLTGNYWQFVNITVIFFQKSIIQQFFSSLLYINFGKKSRNITFSCRKSSYLFLFLLILCAGYEAGVLSCPDDYWHCWCSLCARVLAPGIGTPGLVNPSQPPAPGDRAQTRRVDILWTININKHRHQTSQPDLW